MRNHSTFTPSIPEAFDGQCVFVTGGTGFVGKILVEKLLRACRGIRRIYLLVRCKNGAGVSERLRQILEDQMFDRVRQECGSISWVTGGEVAQATEGVDDRKGPLVVGVTGDMTQLGLGLSESDKAELESRVTLVFHVAATVRFADPLRQSVLLNTRGTREMLALAERMPHLKAFVHVSTAYAPCTISRCCRPDKTVPFDKINEEFYPVPVDPHEVINWAEDDNCPDIPIDLMNALDDHPNTYTFTKALAERLIEINTKHLPIAVFRPSIVMSSLSEPVPGWMVSQNGPTPIIRGIFQGFIGAVLCDVDLQMEMVPVDLTANAMIAIAWDLLVNRDYREEVEEGRGMLATPATPPIFNFVSSARNRVTWKIFQTVGRNMIHKYPLDNAIWFPRFDFTKSRVKFHLSAIFHSTLARALDFWLLLTGHRTCLVKRQRNLMKAAEMVKFFTTNEFYHDDKNVRQLLEKINKYSEHKNSFQIDICQLNWSDFFEKYYRGLRTFVMKQSPNNISKAKSHNNKLKWIKILLQSIAAYLVLHFLIFLQRAPFKLPLTT